jgi:hypothetical protein
MKYGKWIVAAALSAPFFAAPAFADDDKPDMKSTDDQGMKVDLKDLPAAVQKTVREQSANKTLGDIRKVTVMGKTVYKADISSAGKSQTLDISEAGKVTARHDKDMDKAKDMDKDKAKDMDKDKDKPQQPQAAPPPAPKADTDTGAPGNDMQPDNSK